MVIIALFAIKLKAIPNGNPTNNFKWRQKSSSINVAQSNFLCNFSWITGIIISILYIVSMYVFYELEYLVLSGLGNELWN